MSTAYITEIKSEKNTIIVDEPKDHGGENAGLSPMELLAASIGSCTAITLRMYAERKKIDLENVKVEVNFERDSQNNESRMSLSIQLTGNLSDSDREKLLAISRKCPIHQTLSNPIEISTDLAD